MQTSPLDFDQYITLESISPFWSCRKDDGLVKTFFFTAKATKNTKKK